MATLKQARTDAEVKKLPINKVREEYKALAADYNRIVNNEVLLCPSCGKWQAAESSFYLDKRYVVNRFPICKRCLIAMVEQREKEKDPPNETKQSVQRVLQLMDRIYDDDFYTSCVKDALDEAKEVNRSSPFATYITAISSLPQFRGKTWKDSKFGIMGDSSDDVRLIQKTIKAGRKRFGSSYTEEELMFLENEYQEWTSRYEVNTKAQEEVFENLSILKLLKRKALAASKPTKDLDAQTLQYLDAGNLKPRQNSMDSLSDAQTFGTLIQKWEETKPIPEPEDDLKDVDKLGKYIDVFYRGHAAKMFGLDNTFSHLYENEMEKYTVKKPEYNEEEDSEAVFEKIFGTQIDGG